MLEVGDEYQHNKYPWKIKIITIDYTVGVVQIDYIDRNGSIILKENKNLRALKNHLSLSYTKIYSATVPNINDFM